MNSPGRSHPGRPPLIETLACASAFAGGLILAAILGLLVISIASRSLGFEPVRGDYELVQVGMAACIALLLPWCQLQGGNITVDFFTAHLRRRTQRRLDALGALLFALVMAVVSWRTAAGAIVIKAAGETTMILGFPIWIGYAAMIPGLVLTAFAALASAARAWKDGRDE